MDARSHSRLATTLTLFCAFAATLVACGSPSSAAKQPAQPVITKDANGTAITIPARAPQRIVSLGPTDSEILAALGIGSRVVAVDYYTDYPADMAAKPKITNANGEANVEQIIGMTPDLVLSYGGETAATDKQLINAHITVFDLPVGDLGKSLVEIRLIGQLVHADSAATTLVTSLQKRIDVVKAKVAGAPKVSVYMEADDTTAGKPYVFGGGSFGDELIRDAGGTNIFASNTGGGGYPQVSDEDIIRANPQVIVLTEDPNYGGSLAAVYSRTGWSGIAAVQAKRVFAIGTDYTQRAGPRLVDGLEKLAAVLHPDLFPAGA
ncbi:MAG TPA: ABC transporter substrate-binding protein [Ktedonobacterales bacterium]|nr:ABC transporter substrate-binding protein [Ktedonobacterales bacterium]